jgi:hypothetical protein
MAIPDSDILTDDGLKAIAATLERDKAIHKWEPERVLVHFAYTVDPRLWFRQSHGLCGKPDDRSSPCFADLDTEIQSAPFLAAARAVETFREAGHTVPVELPSARRASRLILAWTELDAGLAARPGDAAELVGHRLPLLAMTLTRTDQCVSDFVKKRVENQLFVVVVGVVSV